jgi:hypothetical protein
MLWHQPYGKPRMSPRCLLWSFPVLKEPALPRYTHAPVISLHALLLVIYVPLVVWHDILEKCYLSYGFMFPPLWFDSSVFLIHVPGSSCTEACSKPQTPWRKAQRTSKQPERWERSAICSPGVAKASAYYSCPDWSSSAIISKSTWVFNYCTATSLNNASCGSTFGAL